MPYDKTRRRIAVAEHWDKNAIEEADGEEVDVEVGTPLFAILSIQLDPRYSPHVLIM